MLPELLGRPAVSGESDEQEHEKNIMSAIDLHSHVIPPTKIEVMRHDPQRFGLKV